MNQPFTLDRKSFEQFLAAASLCQSLQTTAANQAIENSPPLIEYSLETLHAADSGTLDLQTALERVAGLALQILGANGAVAWLFTSENLICRAAAGTHVDDHHIRTALHSKLLSAGAFGINAPSTLDLTRTLAKYSGALGSSLAIALLPGGRVAGALAVFSDPSRTFTERNYANLRLLAGLAQYVVTKCATVPERDSLDDSAERYPDRNGLLGINASSSMARSARAPFIFRAPHAEPLQRERIADVDLPGVGTHEALGVDPNHGSEIDTDLQSVSTSDTQGRLEVDSPSNNPVEPLARESSPEGADHNRSTVQRWEEWKRRFKSRRDRALTATLNSTQSMRRLMATTLGVAESLLRRGRNVRVNWFVIGQAAPAFAILAVMSFFVGLMTGGRQPLAVVSMNSVAQAAAKPVTHDSGITANQKAADILVSKKSTPASGQTSHLQITDRETAATIAEFSKYEMRNLRRIAGYGDDQAALELGMLYELGRGVPQNCSKAADWVTKAAQNGNVAAEYNLGLRYKDGDGVPANLAQAESWLRRAASHKNPNAARVLADLHPPSPDPSASLATMSPQPATQIP